MSNTPPFSGAISVFGDEDTGLRIECSERHASAIASHLNQRGFTCGAPETAIKGTDRIHNLVQFTVSSNPFDVLKAEIADHLKAEGVSTTEEYFHLHGEKHIRFNLTNVSVFDK